MLRRITAARSYSHHVSNQPLPRAARASAPFSTRPCRRNESNSLPSPSVAQPPHNISSRENPSLNSASQSIHSEAHRSTSTPTSTNPETYDTTLHPPLSALLPPPAADQAHSSLRSFLAHASRSALSPTSSTYLGTRYEYLTQSVLKAYGFDLARVGGRGDAGIDLLGYWSLPSCPIPLPVLVQCKRLVGRGGTGGKMGPSVVRELEGAMTRGGRGVPGGWRGDEVVGLLVGVKGATRGVREAMRGCGRAVGWVVVEENEVEGKEEGGREGEDEIGMVKGRVTQILWNQKAKEAGLEGIDVVLKYDQQGRGEAVLMWKGKVVGGPTG